jgi:hypothetical protein
VLLITLFASFLKDLHSDKLCVESTRSRVKMKCLRLKFTSMRADLKFIFAKKIRPSVILTRTILISTRSIVISTGV